jgi:pimeloyl-ACP methyl ester carboxylesterase
MQGRNGCGPEIPKEPLMSRRLALAVLAFSAVAFSAVAATLAFPLASPAAAQMKSQMPSLPDIQFAEIPAASRGNYQGDRFSYMEAGKADAPVVLLLHGVGANSMHWRYQLAGLSDRYRVIAWNAPGYMLTDAFAKDTPDCKDYAQSVADFLTALKIERVNIVGNSFGSRVAQCFAMHHPDRVIKLAMTGTGVGPKDMPEEQKAKIIATREAQVAKGMYSFGNRVDALLGPNASADLKTEVQRVLRATQPRGFMHGVKLGMANGYSPEEAGPKLTMPVLLIQGRADKVNPGDTNAAVLIKHLKSGKLEWLENYGHLPEVETPDTVNTMLRDFFG